MTAEVAVLNKSAVAPAADSAMSVRVGNTEKTYPTNKLFALTKQRPIGIMIYNNAEFMNIPWETIIKMYRHELGSIGKATVRAYAEDFLGFIGNAAICTDEQRNHNLLRIANDILYRIAREIDEAARAPSIEGETDVLTVFRNIVDKHFTRLTEAGEAPSMQALDAGALVGEHEAELDELIDRHFPNYAIDSAARRSLLSVFEAAIKSAQLSGKYSGLVFAGFGEDEIFPSLVEVMTDGAVGNVVKADTRMIYDLARTGTRTAIVPFAQSEMVEPFMEGVDPEFMRYLEIYFHRLLTSVYRDMLEATSPGQPLSDDQVSALRNLVDSKVDQFRQDAGALRRDGFVNPILGIVGYLPKEELASMAEALVSLTSLKRRVSMEEESVGGPVDVAVISKGDGLVWIKRKHYFDPVLNRDYLIRQSPILANAQGGRA